jgi:hypothetical protein
MGRFGIWALKAAIIQVAKLGLAYVNHYEDELPPLVVQWVRQAVLLVPYMKKYDKEHAGGTE